MTYNSIVTVRRFKRQDYAGTLYSNWDWFIQLYVVRAGAQIPSQQPLAMLHVQTRAVAKAPGAIFARVRGIHWNRKTIYRLLSVRELNQATGSAGGFCTSSWLVFNIFI